MSDDELGKVSTWFATSPLHRPDDSPPPSVSVDVDFGARSRRGPFRSTNDDHYLIVRLGRYQETLLTSLPPADVPRHFDERAYGMVIADGSGVAGEAASRLAITTLAHLLIYFGRWHVRVDEPIADEVMDRAQRFYRGVDSTLLRSGNESGQSLRTTLTAVFTAGSELFFVHVGHSRAYVFRDDELMQLTHDHTVDRERPRKAAVVDVAPRARDLHHTLTEILGAGGSSPPRIDIERFGLLHGDVILLCTNGLTDVANDAQIANALRLQGTADDQCRALVDLAANSGCKDDVAAVVARYRIGD